jgi:lipopolysaccharide transport system ATP-binding protein
MKPIISVQNLSKRYKLGVFNAKTLREVAEAFLARFSRGKAHTASGRSTLDSRPSTPSVPDEFWALRDVSFDVQPGEVIGVIGRNGAGKSTLLKILSRITEPTSGEARIRGRVASLLEVGTGFHPELTGRENIFLNGAILGMSKAEIRNKFDEIVDFSGIEKFIDTPVKRYSSGMYVRLAFAVAAHLEPEILIVDEVLAVGDAGFQKKCLGKMQEVSGRDGRTVLFVSHNMAAVEALCSRVIWLSAGRNVFDGCAAEGVKNYLRSGLSNQTGSQVSLVNHPNRLGGMRSYLAEFGLTTVNGEPCQTFRQGQLFKITVTYDASAEHDTISGCGIIMKNLSGVQVAAFNTYMLTPPPHKLSGKGKLEFLVKGPAFNPGNYLFTCSIGDHQSKLLDKVEDCMGFEITPYDFYGTGYIVTAEDGVVAFDCEVSNRQ